MPTPNRVSSNQFQPAYAACLLTQRSEHLAQTRSVDFEASAAPTLDIHDLAYLVGVWALRTCRSLVVPKATLCFVTHCCLLPCQPVRTGPPYLYSQYLLTIDSDHSSNYGGYLQHQ
jgi:hypothetical protein